ncbi:MAG: ABC transporter substrate-binding protein [Ilumatobacteraceae bacterium]
MNPPRIRRRLGALARVVAAVGLSACGDDDDSSSATTPDTDAAAVTTEAGAATTPGGTDATSEPTSDGSAPAADVELPDTITIGYQLIPNGDLIVKSEGWLEAAFGPDVTVEWKLFDSGGAVNEAIIAGGIDIGLAGSSPVSRGISNGIEYQVPWIFDVIGEAEALVVRADAGIASVADLAGKTVATPFASTAHYSLLAALQDAGLDAGDVNVIDAQPDAIYASWQNGDIDAAYVWNPNLAKLIAEGGEVLITSAELAAQGKTTYDLAVVTNEFAEQFPGALQLWVDAQDRAVTLLNDDPAAAGEILAAELNITPEEATAQAADLIFVPAAEQAGEDYLAGGLPTNLFAAAEFNQELGEIETVQPEQAYVDAVVPDFAAAVGE